LKTAGGSSEGIRLRDIFSNLTVNDPMWRTAIFPSENTQTCRTGVTPVGKCGNATTPNHSVVTDDSVDKSGTLESPPGASNNKDPPPAAASKETKSGPAMNETSTVQHPSVAATPSPTNNDKKTGARSRLEWGQPSARKPDTTRKTPTVAATATTPTAQHNTASTASAPAPIAQPIATSADLDGASKETPNQAAANEAIPVSITADIVGAVSPTNFLQCQARIFGGRG